MLPHVSKFGIYFNSLEEKVVRITSPYWFPPEPEWVYVTNEVNATHLSIREMIKKQGLADQSDSVILVPIFDF